MEHEHPVYNMLCMETCKAESEAIQVAHKSVKWYSQEQQ